jgi:hypothetical protein
MRVKFSVLQNNFKLYVLRILTFLFIKRLFCRVPERARWQPRDVPVDAGLICGLSQTGLSPSGSRYDAPFEFKWHLYLSRNRIFPNPTPSCIILLPPSYIDSILWHVNHCPWQNTTPACLQDATFHIPSDMCSSSWTEMQSGGRDESADWCN